MSGKSPTTTRTDQGNLEMEMYGMTGERLGTIGGPRSNDTSRDMPKWKLDFLSKPSASTRRGIAWGFNQPYEDTDTLVLTAPSGNFVDIRLPKHWPSGHLVSKSQSFWAFSGHSEVTFYDQNNATSSVGMPYTAHCKFIHDIDSRGPGINDEGDMFLLPNGDYVEMGTMMNPSNGRVELYKEYWKSANLELDTQFLTLSESSSNHPCIVAKTTRSGVNRGLMIRFGRFAQGLYESPSNGRSEKLVEHERWERHIKTNPTHANIDRGKRDVSFVWHRDPRSNVSLPFEWLVDDARCMGNQTTVGGVMWEIVEVQR